MDEIVHPFSNFNGCTVAVWECLSNFIPHSIDWACNKLSTTGIKLNHVSKKGYGACEWTNQMDHVYLMLEYTLVIFKWSLYVTPRILFILSLVNYYSGTRSCSQLSLHLLHKSHNAPVPYPTIQHFVTEMCTHVHISVTKWCIMGYLSGTWDLWDGCFELVDGTSRWNCARSSNELWRFILRAFTRAQDVLISIYERPCVCVC